MAFVRVPARSMFAAVTFYMLLFSSFCQGQSRRRPDHPRRGHHIDLPPLPDLSKSLRNSGKFFARNGSACIELPPVYTPAPKRNVWSQLGYAEVVAVKEFLYNDKELNLSKGYSYYGYGYSSNDGTTHTLGNIELMHPNKTDVVPYLDGTGPEPGRYAKTQINTSKDKSYKVQEIIVGPIGTDAPMTWAPLSYPYTRKGGSIEETYEPEHMHSADQLSHQIKNSSQDIFTTLWPWLNHTWYFYAGLSSVVGLSSQDEDKSIGNAFWYSSETTQGGDNYALGGGFSLGLYYGIQVNADDVHNPIFLGWIYDNVLYKTTQDFRSALKHGNITRPIPSRGGPWSEGGQHGPELPLDNKPPPQAVAPAGSRFYLDHSMKYVHWMDFSFYMGWTPNRGWAFYDIRHKGQRILYELSLQEALAHYAGTDPSISNTWYRDAGSYYLGNAIVELVPGYDCPSYAQYWGTHVAYGNGKPYVTPKSVCFFEFDADFPIARHSAQYVAARKNIFFVVRSVYTVGNYDYMFSYEFYLDGSIKVTVRASGYIEDASSVGNHEYGYRIHQDVSGSMHDHTLNFKADFDILGTANTMQLTSFVPANQKYLWSDEPRETFKLRRELIKSEDNSRLDWDRATQYAVVNRDQPNEWGEYRGYRIMPADGTTHFTNKKSTNAKELIHPFTFDMAVTQQHDTEPQSTDPNDEIDLENPLVNFNKFFNGENLVQEDLVTWINLGMHHLPHTGDLPFTLFTTAHASVQFSPLNYYPYEVSTQSLSQVQINFKYSHGNYSVSEVDTYGQAPAWCSIDLSKEAPDLYQAEG